MKKVLFSFLAVTLLGLKAWAVTAPTDARGDSLNTIDFVGCQTASIDASTGTALVIINSTGSPAISSGRAIVYGVIISSISQGDYIVFKDTTGANGTTGGLATQNSLQMVGTTVAVVTNFFANTSTFTFQPNYAATNFYKFPVPLQFRNGILANVSAAPASSNGVARWTILYRKMDQSER